LCHREVDAAWSFRGAGIRPVDRISVRRYRIPRELVAGGVAGSRIALAAQSTLALPGAVAER
jgi:hypothetical protein